MKLKKKFAVVLLVLSMMMTQTGCITGFLVPPLLLPLVITGVVVAVPGGVMIGMGAYKRSTPLIGTGTALLIVGGILDEENPGQMDALNPISRDQGIARELGVTLDDITDYNNNLNQIREVLFTLSQDLHSQLKRPEFRGLAKFDELAKDLQIDSLARKYGFSSGQELIETFKTDRLSSQALERFSQATQLSIAQAKILLKYGFAVNSN
jgi:hypothetical protein